MIFRICTTPRRLKTKNLLYNFIINYLIFSEIMMLIYDNNYSIDYFNF